MEHILTMADLKSKPFLFTPRPSIQNKICIVLCTSPFPDLHIVKGVVRNILTMKWNFFKQTLLWILKYNSANYKSTLI